MAMDGAVPISWELVEVTEKAAPKPATTEPAAVTMSR
jgi:hypothetical protein